MKKTLLSALALAAAISMNGQACTKSGLDKGLKGFYYDGGATTAVSFIDGLDTTYAGLYWWDQPSPEIPGFSFTKADGVKGNGMKLTVSQAKGGFEPIGVGFGNYKKSGDKITLNLTSDQTVSFTATNNSTEEILLKVALQDILGKNADTYASSEIGTHWGDEIALRIPAGETQSFPADAYDNPDAPPINTGDKFVGAKQTTYSPGSPSGLEGDDRICDDEASFEAVDFTKIAAATFTVVGTVQDAQLCYDREAISNIEVIIKDLRVGACPTAVGILNNVSKATFSVFPNPSNGVANFSTEVTNVTVMDATGNVVETIEKATSINTSSYNKGIYMIKADQGTSKVVVE